MGKTIIKGLFYRTLCGLSIAFLIFFRLIRSLVWGILKVWARHIGNRIRSVFYVRTTHFCPATQRKILTYTPQPLEVWIIAYAVILAVVVGILAWNIGISRGMA